MTNGDHVVHLGDPLGHGIGVISHTCRDGRLAIAWPDHTTTPGRVTFQGAHDLELAARFTAGHGAHVLDDLDLMQLSGQVKA